MQCRALEQPAAGASFEFNKEDGTLYIDWSGPMVVGMADDLRTGFDKYGRVLDRVVLFLDSAGGLVEEGDRVIAILNEIKLRHQLITVGAPTASCVRPCAYRSSSKARIVLRREQVSGSSTEAAQRQANGELRTDTAETWRLFRKSTLRWGLNAVGSKVSHP